jgi:hypothetical protein
VTEAGPLLWHTNHGRYLPGAEPSAGGTSAARGQTLAALVVPAQEPGVDWFLHILAGQPFPDSVRCDLGTGRGAVTQCTFVADLTAGEAVIAVTGDHPVAIPLPDLAEGHPHAQRSFAGGRH